LRSTDARSRVEKRKLPRPVDTAKLLPSRRREENRMARHPRLYILVLGCAVTCCLAVADGVSIAGEKGSDD